MNISEIGKDNITFILSIILGFGYGIYYEIFRFLRIAFHHKTFMVFIEDMLFFIPITFSFLLFAFIRNSGELRYSVFIGIAIGFIFYFITLGKILKFFSNAIISFIKKILFLIKKKYIIPIYDFFVKIAKMLFTKLKRIAIMIKNNRRRSKHRKIQKQVLKDSEKGFHRRI